MQIFGLFTCTQSALHVSGVVFAHHQEHLTVFSASDIVQCNDRFLQLIVLWCLSFFNKEASLKCDLINFKDACLLLQKFKYHKTINC